MKQLEHPVSVPASICGTVVSDVWCVATIHHRLMHPYHGAKHHAKKSLVKLLREATAATVNVSLGQILKSCIKPMTVCCKPSVILKHGVSDNDMVYATLKLASASRHCLMGTEHRRAEA